MKRHFYCCCVSMITALVPSAWGAESTPPPNIILIMADDLGYEALGTYGSADYSTPVLDTLAATGMKFNHCYSQPLCTPSRVQIMTGQYNFRNYQEFGVLPKKTITFAHLLREAGYATAVVGKWQLYGANSSKAQAKGMGCRPEEAGFDDYCLWQIDQRPHQGERYADPLVDRKGLGPKSLQGAYGPEVFTDFILEFIEAKQDDPFFVYYPMVLTHNPFVPTPDTPEWEEENRYAKNPKHFGDMVTYMDKMVGRIVEKLDALDLSENTLLIFVGDNGTHRNITSRMRDGRMVKGNKGYPDDGGTHVPLIVHWPGTIKAGIANENLIDFSDFLPTLVEASGAMLPQDRIIDGQSFLAQLQGKPGTTRDWVFCHYDPRWYNFVPIRFARTQRWKLYGDGRFFDISKDVLEERPLPKNLLPLSARKVYEELQAVLDRMI